MGDSAYPSGRGLSNLLTVSAVVLGITPALAVSGGRALLATELDGRLVFHLLTSLPLALFVAVLAVLHLGSPFFGHRRATDRTTSNLAEPEPWAGDPATPLPGL